MKTLLAGILFSTLGLCAYAQNQVVANPDKTSVAPKTTVVQATLYRCPVCGYKSAKAGDCPKDKTALIKVGDYYCPECYMTGKKPGKCPMCGVDMKKMEAADKAK